LSIRAAAGRIGISPSYLVAIERGRNPSTGRPPMPSPPILAAIGRVLDIGLPTLLEAVGASAFSSAHLLLYQRGGGHFSPLEAARALYAGQVDTWIEIVDPRASAEADSPSDDVLIRRRRSLIPAQAESPAFDTAHALRAISDLLGEVPHSGAPPRLGIIFGASSAALRSIANPPVLLASEKTWEQDVGATFRAALGVEPAACVCVYREADIEELGARFDPLATVVSLIETHAHVAVQDTGAGVTTGPAAIETILAGTRPTGVSGQTWESLARAAAIGFVREAATAPGPGLEGA
jgi:transcriptional regulator with XRE-family HTH domain